MLVNRLVKLSLDIFNIWLMFCCSHSLFSRALADGSLSKFHMADIAGSGDDDDDDDVAAAGNQRFDDEADAASDSILSNSFDDNKMENV